MIKLNLLEAKPVRLSGGLEEIKESDILSDETFLRQEQAEPQPAVEEIPAEAPKAKPTSEPIKKSEEKAPEEFTFEKKSKIPVVPILVVLLLAAIGVGYFLLTQKSGAPQKPKVAVKKTPTKTQPAPSKTQKPVSSPAEKAPHTQPSQTPKPGGTAPVSVPPTVPVEARAQRNAGIQAVTVFGKVLSGVPAGAQIGFLSFDGHSFTLELFANRPTKLEKFLQNAQTAISGAHYKVLAKDRDYFQGRRLPHLLLSGELSPSGFAQPGLTSLTPSSIGKSLRQLAVRHKVRVRELRVAAPAQENGQRRVRVTLKVSGAQAAIQAFLSDLLKQYANLGVSRLFVSASKTGAAGRLDVAADLNVFLQ